MQNDVRCASGQPGGLITLQSEWRDKYWIRVYKLYKHACIGRRPEKTLTRKKQNTLVDS